MRSAQSEKFIRALIFISGRPRIGLLVPAEADLIGWNEAKDRDGEARVAGHPDRCPPEGAITMDQGTIIPEVLDPGENGPKSAPRGDWPPRAPSDEPNRGAWERILSSIKSLLFGALILAGIVLAVLFGSVLFLIFVIVFFLNFLLSGLFGRGRSGTGSIIVERYGPAGEHEVRYTRLEGSPRSGGPGDRSGSEGRHR